jgi:hypothetical protein
MSKYTLDDAMIFVVIIEAHAVLKTYEKTNHQILGYE